jgi:hypothetical protein
VGYNYVKEIQMKLWQGIVVALILLALPVMSGCACGSKISADEAIAIVMQSGEESIVDFPGLGHVKIPEGLPHPPQWGEWSASYEGKGHWVVTCCFDYRDAPWNLPNAENLMCTSYDYFEDSGIVQLKEYSMREP